MTKINIATLEPPRIESAKPLLIAGFKQRYAGTQPDIPTQWRRFAPHIGNVTGQVGQATYGVVSVIPGGTEGFDYLSGVEVSGSSDLPDCFSHVRMPAGKFAVFEHCGHVSAIRNTMHAIWNEWLPQSGYDAIESADFFERYGKDFDPRTGLGVVELWIPLKT